MADPRDLDPDEGVAAPDRAALRAIEGGDEPIAGAAGEGGGADDLEPLEPLMALLLREDGADEARDGDLARSESDEDLLGGYRALLEHARDALSEAPREGWQEAVLQAARQPAFDPVASGAHVVSPARLEDVRAAATERRRVLASAVVPLLAVAAACVLTFMALRPGGWLDGAGATTGSSEDAVARGSARSDERRAETPGAPSEGPHTEDGDLADLEAALAKDTPAPAEAKPNAPHADAGSAAEGAADGDVAGGARSDGGAAHPEPKKAAKPAKSGGKADDSAPIQESKAEKESAWSTLESAHKQRHKGSCALAKASYQAVIDANADTLARARAEAGMALCLDYEGRSYDAKAHYATARSLDPSIDTWISRERDKMPVADEKSQSRHKAKQAVDPEAL